MTDQEKHVHFILPSGFTLCDALEQESDEYVRMPADIKKAAELTKVHGFCGVCWGVWLSLTHEVRNADENYESFYNRLTTY
jgi:hypothetical protein